MGFFDKIKQNFSHGGIKISLDVPNTLSETDSGFIAKVTLTNDGTAPQTIKSLKVALVEDHGMANSQNQQSGIQYKDIATSTQEGPIVLAAGETKQLDIAVALNFGKFLGESVPDNPIINAAASVLGAIQNVSEAMNTQNYRHYVQVVADVDGVAFDPSAKSDVQLLRPGQIGAGLNINI